MSQRTARLAALPDALLARRCRQLRLAVDYCRAGLTWGDISELVACEAECAARDINPFMVGLEAA